MEHNTLITGFREKQGFELVDPLNVSATAPGTYASSGSLVGGTIPAGTVVNSFFLSADPIGSGDREFAGVSITFASDILGVMVRDLHLDSSISVLGNPGTVYPTVTSVGYEMGSSSTQDNFTISADRRTITLHTYTGDIVDQMRVVTAHSPESVVPEPGAWILFLPALAIVGILRRRREA